MSEDESHLNSLAVAHYVVGAVMVLFSCFPLIHVTVGLGMVAGSLTNLSTQGNAPPAAFGWLFVIMGLGFFLVMQAISVSIIVSGRFLQRRKNHLFSFILGCISCMFFPFGTVLGVFTIIVLSRDSVKQRYADAKTPPLPPTPPSPSSPSA